MSPHSTPLKILHIASGDLWAGAEVQAYTLLCAFHDNPDVQVSAALLNDGELAERLRARAIPVYIFAESALNSLQILLGLRKLMRAWQPDIVHTHRMKENVLGSLANWFAGRAPSVRTIHGAREHAPQGLRQIHKRLFHCFDQWCGLYLQQRIIAVTSDLANVLATDFPPKKIVVIENGIDIEATQAAIHPIEFRNNSEPHTTHIGIVGRLVPVKRADLFLEAAALIKQQAPERSWHFHIFGDGPLRAQLVGQAQRLGLDSSVTFHGHRRDIVACIAALDVLLICSDHEGLPMTLLEALAAQTPVVAHAVGGIAEVLNNGCGGVALATHTAPAYAENIIQLLRMDRSELIRAGLVRLQRYSAQQNQQAMLRLYTMLASAQT